MFCVYDFIFFSMVVSSWQQCVKCFGLVFLSCQFGLLQLQEQLCLIGKCLLMIVLVLVLIVVWCVKKWCCVVGVKKIVESCGLIMMYFQVFLVFFDGQCYVMWEIYYQGFVGQVEYCGDVGVGWYYQVVELVVDD